MKTIHKYQLDLAAFGEHSLMVPRGSVPMSCALQHGKISVWFLVNTDFSADEDCRLFISGTGMPLPEVKTLALVGTIVTDPFVYHVFYKGTA